MKNCQQLNNSRNCYCLKRVIQNTCLWKRRNYSLLKFVDKILCNYEADIFKYFLWHFLNNFKTWSVFLQFFIFYTMNFFEICLHSKMTLYRYIVIWNIKILRIAKISLVKRCCIQDQVFFLSVSSFIRSFKIQLWYLAEPPMWHPCF